MVPESPGHNYLNLDGATESSKPTTPSTPAQATVANDSSNSGKDFIILHNNFVKLIKRLIIERNIKFFT